MELLMIVVLLALCILFVGVLVLGEFGRKRQLKGHESQALGRKLDEALVTSRREVRRLDALHESWAQGSTVRMIRRTSKS